MGGTRISVHENRQSWNYHSAQASGSRLYLFLLLNTLTNHITLGTLALECAVEGKRLTKMAYREGGR